AIGAYKNESLDEIKTFMVTSTANTNRDVIPNSIWREYVFPAMQEQGITTRQMKAGIQTAYCGSRIYNQNVSRGRAARVAKAVNSEYLSRLAESDIYWDEIIKIEFEQEEEVFDLTVPVFHNFMGAKSFIHNSIEQDADVVCFIYRDE